MGNLCGIDLVKDPGLAAAPQHQPAILAAFWSWKKLNTFADAKDFEGCVLAWNGGRIGMASRRARLQEIFPVIDQLQDI